MKRRLRISLALAVLLAAALLFWPRAVEEPDTRPSDLPAPVQATAATSADATPSASLQVPAEPRARQSASPGGDDQPGPCAPFPEPLAEFTDDELARELDGIADLLQASRQEEHWLAAAFVRATDRERALTEFSALYEMNPDSALAFWGLLAECVQRSGFFGDCTEKRLLAGAEKFNGGQIWATLAGYFHIENEPEAALAALERAATAPALAEPIAEIFRIVQPALQVSGEFDARQRLTLLFAVPNNNPVYWGVLDACRESGANDERWQAACSTLGARIETESYALLTQRLGLLMQKEQATFANRTTVLAAIEARMADTEGLIQQFRKVEATAMGEETLLRAYIEQLMNADEATAMRFVINEIERLGLDVPDAGCVKAE